MNNVTRTKSRHQVNWDWRAAGNFIGGGTGSGLLLFAALSSGSSYVYRPFACAALALIALGLFCVWLEIGRPWRAMNVFLHAKTSWMTREALVAPPLFLCGLLAAWMTTPPWTWLAALLGLLFLYCQARIIHGGKGIPAWREARIVPLMIVTGVTEGAGLLGLVAALSGAALKPGWVPAILVPLLILRMLLWRAYRKDLAGHSAPQQTVAAFDAIEPWFGKASHWGAGLLLVLALVVPTLDNTLWLSAIAGVIAVAGGWLFKFTLVARAAYNQGYALPRVPVRGGVSKPG